MGAQAPFVIGIPIYDGVDPLDVAGPFELFNAMADVETPPGARTRSRSVVLVSADKKLVAARYGLHLQADHRFEDSPDFDLLWVPGGTPDALERLMPDARFNGFLRRQARHAKYVTSVCEGALLAAAAGLLDGYRVTTHWAFIPCLKLFPKVEVVDGFPRYVVDRNRVTGGGISSGLDEALQVIALLSDDIVAQKVQLAVQYNPRPPFIGGDPSTARPPIIEPGTGTTCVFPGLVAAIGKIVRCA